MFSRFFIDRPIFAAVLSIFIMIAGLARCAAADRASTPRSRRRW
jgi:multidrug efflux pump subunit AcrB